MGREKGTREGYARLYKDGFVDFVDFQGGFLYAEIFDLKRVRY